MIVSGTQTLTHRFMLSQLSANKGNTIRLYHNNRADSYTIQSLYQQNTMQPDTGCHYFYLHSLLGSINKLSISKCNPPYYQGPLAPADKFPQRCFCVVTMARQPLLLRISTARPVPGIYVRSLGHSVRLKMTNMSSEWHLHFSERASNREIDRLMGQRY